MGCSAGVCYGAGQGLPECESRDGGHSNLPSELVQAAFTPSLQHSVETQSKAMFPFPLLLSERIGSEELGGGGWCFPAGTTGAGLSSLLSERA